MVAGVVVGASEIGRGKHAAELKLPYQPPARSGVRVVTVVPPYSLRSVWVRPTSRFQVCWVAKLRARLLT